MSTEPRPEARARVTADAPATAETKPFEAYDWALLVTAAGIWGASFLFMDIALDDFEPGLITLLRIAFGFVTVSAFSRARKPIERRDRSRVAALGFTWMAFPFTLFPLAQQWIDSSLTGMLNSAMPIMTLIIGAVAFHSPIIRAQLIGVLVGVVGILLIGIPTATASDTSAVGVILALVAVMSYGVAANINVPLTQKYGSLPVISTALGWAVLFTLPFGVVDGARSSFSWSALAACAAVGIGGTGVAYVAAATLGGRVGAVRMSIITYLVPIVAAVLGVVFRDETLGVSAIIGTGVVLCGAWIASRSPSYRSTNSPQG